MENMFILFFILGLFPITVVFSASCQYWAISLGPLATEGCHIETNEVSGFIHSFGLECRDPSIDEVTYVNHADTYTCDVDDPTENTFPEGAHCDDTSNDCSLIEMTIFIYSFNGNCEGDYTQHRVYVLTDGPLNDGECHERGNGGNLYTYDEINGLTVFIWSSSHCIGTHNGIQEFPSGCTSFGSSSRFVTFMHINDDTNEPTEEPTEHPILLS